MSKSKSNDILFFTNSELGQASVILAVAEELVRHESADARIHLASFSPLRTAVPDGITFHCLPGLSMKQVFASRGMGFLPKHEPGLQAVRGYSEAYSKVLAPWDEAKYFPIFDSCCKLIEEVKPCLVVLDPLLGAAYDACVFLGQRHVILSPNTFKDHVTGAQPGLEPLYKFALLGSGFKPPLNFLSVLCNIYLAIAIHIYAFWSAPVRQLTKARNRRGITGPLSTIFDEVNPELLYLVQSKPQSDFPLHLPPNVIGCGPILPSFKPLAETNPDLSSWLDTGPTIVINMGSHVTHESQQINEILHAIERTLEKHAKLQVLWKLQSDTLPSIPPAIASRVRVMAWLPGHPAAILTASNKIVAYVHHGGSNSFHEAVAAGVPHVVCPVWLDTYDFATRVEYLDIGVWANRTRAPEIKGEDLAEALELVSSGAAAERLRTNARKLANIVGDVNAGRKTATAKILEVTKPVLH
ncbi:hypothetical protein B0T16DRAFT_411164 [Cercophora newfieldiana]|uniref:Glycosyltransferase n=1 Tax=Cercophora newfieldiana TaxID=92897 RepID=A0AA39Y3N4_9PEZI|nr:hypothetical protein B0T16DRAFT_411164 [Cercophora newfieldiana]